MTRGTFFSLNFFYNFFCVGSSIFLQKKCVWKIKCNFTLPFIAPPAGAASLLSNCLSWQNTMLYYIFFPSVWHGGILYVDDSWLATNYRWHPTCDTWHVTNKMFFCYSICHQTFLWWWWGTIQVCFMAEYYTSRFAKKGHFHLQCFIILGTCLTLGPHIEF